MSYYYLFFLGLGLVSPTVSFINGKEGKIVEREQWSIGRARYFLQYLFFFAYVLLYTFYFILFYFTFFFLTLKTDYPALQFTLD